MSGVRLETGQDKALKGAVVYVELRRCGYAVFAAGRTEAPTEQAGREGETVIVF